MLKMDIISERMELFQKSIRQTAKDANLHPTTFATYTSTGRPLESMTVKNYKKLMQSLFTPFEIAVIEMYGDYSVKTIIKLIEDFNIPQDNIKLDKVSTEILNLPTKNDLSVDVIRLGLNVDDILVLPKMTKSDKTLLNKLVNKCIS